MAERTTIEVDTETRTRLRVWKAARDMTYNEAINQLLDDRETDAAMSTSRAATDEVEQEPDIDEIERCLQAAVEDLDLPGQAGGRLEARRTAILSMARRLRELEMATKDELLEVVDAGECGFQSREIFWSNIVRSQKALHELPHVESPDQGGNSWIWTE